MSNNKYQLNDKKIINKDYSRESKLQFKDLIER
jgi:hypothetical protein